jgi:isopentenyl-diphosphate Delta-isomerase
MEEAIQHNGDTDFAGSLARLHELVGMLGYPVLLKEVGHGIGARAIFACMGAVRPISVPCTASV